MGEFYSMSLLLKVGATPSSWVCLILTEYSYTVGNAAMNYPIYPGEFELLVPGYAPTELSRYVEVKYRGYEGIIKLLKLKAVYELEEPINFLANAFTLFKSENYSAAKAEAGKALEKIRGIVGSWKEIDSSRHLAEAVKKFSSALYDICSTGGAHLGIARRDRARLVLNEPALELPLHP